MASNTAAYAAGDQQWKNVSKGDETVSLKGRRRRTVWLSQQPRPLFVAEAEFKPSKYFTRVKKCMLVLYGAELLIVDVAALDAADSATAAADMSVAVLKLISYSELLDVSVVGSGSRILKIQYGDSSDRPKVAGSALLGLDATANSSTGSTRDTNGLDTTSVPATEAYSFAGTSVTAVGGSPAGATSLRVTYDSFTLLFKDTVSAQEAAAALLFQRAQHAAVKQWLHQGLHAGFRCDTVALRAVPAALSSSNNATDAAHSGRRSSGPFAAAAGLQAAVNPQNPPGPYPWGSVSSGWGCSVGLPASWGDLLDTAAGQIPVDPSDSPDITSDDLSCLAGLSQGPHALQLQFTTPLGLAAATIKPHHVRAAMLNHQCRQILAVPVHKSGNANSWQQQQQGVVPGFSWTVAGRVPAGTSSDGSGSSNSVAAVAASEPSAASLAAGDAASLPGGSSSGLTTSYSVEVYAVLTVEVHQTPQTAGKRGAGRVYNPAIAGVSVSGGAVPPPTQAQQQQHQQQPGLDAGSSLAEAPPGAVRTLQSNVWLLQNLQLVAAALLAAVSAMQLRTTPLIALLQLLIAVAIVLTNRFGPASNISSTSNSAQQSKANPGTTEQVASTVEDADSNSDQFEDAGPDPAEYGTSSSPQEEDITCCGWSIKLIAGDVIATPSRYLQLQVSMARADEGLAQLRQRMLTMSRSMSLSGGGAVPLRSFTARLPVLVSEPEPAWLYADNKQRFLNAKPTLAASQEQAQRTNKWRVRADIDNVLRKPIPGFEEIAAAFPTYTLMNNSADGHAVVMMKVGAVKDLCDLVFNPPEGKGVTLQHVEHALAFFNEYLIHVAAPDPLPAGFQVQVYDMEGFKLGYVNGDMITLFKVLVRFGHYYPERLKQALVINAPAWFSYPWKLLSSFLDANTSAKVVVVGPAKAALSTLAHHMGGAENVPTVWGGKDPTPLDQFPDQLGMMQFARRLNAGEQPLKECKRVSAMFAEEALQQ